MNKLKIVKGNTFDTLIEVRAYTYSGEEIENFSLYDCTDIIINARVKDKVKSIKDFSIEDAKHLLITWKAKNLDTGSYSLEVTGKYLNIEWRFYDRKPIFDIVFTNTEANIPQQSIIRENFYLVDKQNLYLLNYNSGTADISGLATVATTGSYTDLINKPTIPAKVTKTSQLINDSGFLTSHQDISGKVDRSELNTVAFSGDYNDLTNKPTIPQGSGLSGLDGKSAYELAVDNGFEGTVLQWLASLKGEDGQDGQDGRNGIDGTNGTNGQDGQDGHTPVITTTKSGKVTTIFADGVSIGTILDGEDGTAGGSVNLIQSDWDQSDNSAVDFIKNKPTIPIIPTNVSSFTNDAGYLTSHLDISGKVNSSDLAAVATSGSYTDLINTPTIPTVPTNVSSFTNDAGYLTSHQDISGKANTSDLATVATSGSYADLTNTPSIPAAQILSDWNLSDNTSLDFIKNKPTIPTVPTAVSSFTNDAGYITTSNTSGLIKNDGTIDTNTYLTQHQSLSGYIQTSNTSGLLKNDGTVDTTTYAKIWSGTQSQYTALSPNYDSNTIYIIT